MKIIVTVDYFGDIPRRELESLERKGHAISYYVKGRVLTEEETKEILREQDPDAIIAGTEKYTAEILSYANNLKIISRVGIGLDSVDLEECQKRGIKVVNTPDAPSNAAAELTVGKIINACRKISNADREIKNGIWNRHIGKDLSESVLGIIGYGRIGKLVAKKMKSLAGTIYVNDTDPSQLEKVEDGLVISSVSEIIRKSDILTLHIPLDKNNENFISKEKMKLMKGDSILVNVSRGGIVNEEDLFEWLSSNPNASAAIDVFEKEPYEGKLRNLSNCYLTPHLGSCTLKSRIDMEAGAVHNLIDFIESSARQ